MPAVTPSFPSFRTGTSALQFTSIGENKMTSRMTPPNPTPKSGLFDHIESYTSHTVEEMHELLGMTPQEFE